MRKFTTGLFWYVTFLLYLPQSAMAIDQVSGAKKILRDSFEFELTGTIEDTTAVLEYLDMASKSRINRKLKESRKYYFKSLETYNNITEPIDSLLIKIYLGITSYYVDVRQIDSSYNYIQKVLELCPVTFKGGHPLYAKALENMGVYWLRKNEPDKALNYLEKSLEMKETCFGPTHIRLATTYGRIGLIWKSKDDLKKAQSYFEKSLEVGIKEDPNHRTVASNYGHIGAIWLLKGVYEKGIYYLTLALKLDEERYGSDDERLSSSLDNIGACYIKLGDYDRALQFLERGKMIKIKKLGEGHQRLTSTYHNMAIIYKKKKNYEKSLFYYRKALDLRIKKKGHEDVVVAKIYSSISLLFEEMGDYEKASYYIGETLKIRKKKLDPQHSEIALTYNKLGVISSEKHDYKNALFYYKEALEVLKSKGDDVHRPHLSSVYNNIGGIQLHENKEKEACQYYRKSLQALDFSFDEPDDFSKVSDLNRLQNTFKSFKKYYTYEYEETQDNIYIDSLNSVFNASLSLEEYKQEKLRNSNSRLFYTAKSIPIYEGAIANILRNGNSEKIERTFMLSEKTKGRLLVEKVQSIGYNNSFGLPQALREKEKQVSVDLAYFEKKRYKTNSVKDTLKKDSLFSIYDNMIFQLKRRKDSLLNVFKTDYTTYYSLRYSQEVISVKEVQEELLNPNQALLEYFVGDSSLFIFTITKTDFQVKEVKRDFPLNALVKQMRSAIYQPFLDSDKKQSELDSLSKQYVDAAYNLYEKLILPVKDFIPQGAELIIIPDGVIGYIPFDALLTSPPDDVKKKRDYPYFVKEHQVSFSFSAKLLKEMRNKIHKEKATKTFLGVAPSFKNNNKNTLATRFIDTTDVRNQLGQLKYNIAEVKGLQKLIGGDVLIDSFATEEAFLKMAAEYQILHLATHGKANDKKGDYSFLAFYEQKDSLENEWLYNRELYELELNADLIVLSACETGIGELQRGEGIISLARGFSYAGAKSIITSLWNVNDKETKEFMELFYSYVKEGQSKDAALRNAKLSYLKISTNPEPYFWASFVPIGDMAPIEFNRSGSFGYWGLGGFSLLLFFFWYWRRK